MGSPAAAAAAAAAAAPDPALLLQLLLLITHCSPCADGLSCKVDHSICCLHCLIDLRQAVKLEPWVLQLGLGTVYIACEHAHFVALSCQLGSQSAAYQASSTCSGLGFIDRVVWRDAWQLVTEHDAKCLQVCGWAQLAVRLGTTGR
jgi:hypothetical protein